MISSGYRLRSNLALPLTLCVETTAGVMVVGGVWENNTLTPLLPIFM